MQFILTRTPLRMSFFGGGSDYPEWCNENRGAVLSATIDKYIYLSCRYLPPFFGIKHRVVWRHVELVDSISEILHPAIREGLRYFQFDDNRGVEMHYQADLPARSGMGSSSSFVVGMVAGLLSMKMEEFSKKTLAQKAIDLELVRMKESVGLQDQVAAAYGGLNRIEFGPDCSFDVVPLPLSEKREANFHSNLMLFYIGSNRNGPEIAETIINNIQDNSRRLTRMVELVDEAHKALVDGNINDVGEMMHETWILKRGLSSHISTSIIDGAYETARSAGAVGGKLLGAGGTGFMLFFVPPEKQAAVRDAMALQFMEVPFQFDKTGAQVIYQNHQ